MPTYSSNSVSFIESIRFTSQKANEEMENMTAEEMVEKMAQAMEFSRKRAEKKKGTGQDAEKGKAVVSLKTKTKALPCSRSSK